jgi:outer membrane protein OmpA-like peptidoglycan-associated protein
VEQVKFGYNNDRIMPESEPIMNAVLRIFQDHADVQHVEIHGHTDSQGSDAYNLRLSQRRAQAVAKWLTIHGIAKERVSAQGFGETKPLDANDTEEGRRNNRRVEFHIVKRDEK